MEQIDMIEKLREKADLTYDEAKGVLEACGWNLLDALVALEKEGKLKETKSMDYTTKHDYYNEYENAGTVNKNQGTFKETVKKAALWVKKILVKGMNNNFVVIRESGKYFEIPVTVLAILMIPAFWAVTIALIIAFFCGCRFRFTGPDLGTDKVNSVMDNIKFTTSESKKKEHNSYDIDDRK